MELSEQTWTDMEAASARCVLIPIGSTEQHGPHAPLGTDAVIAKTMADAGAAAFSDEVIVTPTIPIGASAEHRRFTGTMWVQPATLRAYVRDVIRSVIHNGWDRIVLVNGHGGNVGALKEVAAAITREEPDVIVVPFTWFEVLPSGAYEMGHAGALETGVLRTVAPDLVREDRVDTARDGASDQWGSWVGGVNLSVDTDEFSENGVVGDPSAGDAALGDEVIDTASQALVEVLEAITNGA